MLLKFPQWQGIGFPTNVTEGANRMASWIDAGNPVDTVPVTEKHAIVIEDGIYGRAEILAQYKAALDIMRQRKAKRVFTIGGDCGIEVAPSTYLNDLYGGDIQIFWFDAHADINTPSSSFSAHFHGMPLSILLGEEPSEFTDLVTRKITPDQIAFAGLRSIDPPEEEYLAEKAIKNLTFADLPNMPKKYKNAILHVDTDVLDASIYNECSTPTSGGVDFETLVKGCTHVYENYNVVGATITEYAPGKADVAAPLIRELLNRGLRANAAQWVE